MKQRKYHREPARRVPVAEEVDILVVGGGLAGTCAAIAAGRMGLKTLLVEYFGCLGGNATTGLVCTFCGFFTKPNHVPVVKGIGGELVQAMIDRHAASDVKGWTVSFDPESLKLLLDEKMKEAGVQLLYYTQMLDAIVERGEIQGIMMANKGGRKAILAKRVLDCTGDGDVCASAKVPFELGDGKGGFHACDAVFHLINIGREFDAQVYEKILVPETHKAASTNQYTFRSQPIIRHTMIPGAYWVNLASIPWVVNGIDPHHLTEATIEGRRAVREALRFLKDKVPGFEAAEIISTAPKIGVRETRRVLGKHLLTGEEVLQGKKFDDGIGANAWPVEFETARDREFIFLKGDDFHTIPYRSLIPRKIKNLLMAGRFVSCTHEAQASLRVTGPATAMGQAIGTAAALSIKEKVAPSELKVQHLQQALERAGAYLG